METEKEDSKTKLDPETLQFLYNFVEKNHALLIDNIDKLDQKIANLIAATAITISILTYNVFSGVFVIELLSILGGILIIISFVIGIKGYFPKAVSTNDPKKTWDSYFNYSYDKACEQVTSNLTATFDKNVKLINAKAKFIKLQLVTLIIGILFIFISKFYMSFKFVWNIIFN
jgi:hypothetical protein